MLRQPAASISGQLHKSNRTPLDLIFLGEKLRETKHANLLAEKMMEKAPSLKGCPYAKLSTPLQLAC